MDELERAAELINAGLAALSIAAGSNPHLRTDFARRCDRLLSLRNEVDAARKRRIMSGHPDGDNGYPPSTHGP